MTASHAKPHLRYFFNGNIITMDPASPRAPHMLLAGDRISHCSDGRAPLGLDFRESGFATLRQRLGGEIDFVDLKGRTVIPGLTDAHAHFVWWTLNASQADLTTSTSEDHAISLLREHVGDVPPGEWVLGFGWTHNLWDDPKLPSRTLLDAAYPDNPVFLNSKCSHVAWVNSAALKAAGVDVHTSDPPGGEIERVRDGEATVLTGILKENAMALVENMIPKVDDAARSKAMAHGQKVAHELGITCVNDPEYAETFAYLQRAEGRGELTMRISFLLPLALLPQAEKLGLAMGFGGNRLRIAGVKLFADGSLGGRTAYMYEPYEGEPGNLGIATLTDEELRDGTLRANRLGLPAAIHAIGDKAVGVVLDAFRYSRETLAAEGRPFTGHNRIEHLQLFAEGDIDALRREKPIASVQPVHLCADMGPADRYWGKRARYAYALRTLKNAGCVLAFGSDAPVEPISPFYGMYAAVTRKSLKGEPDNGWYPEECLSPEEALWGYTVGPAIAAGNERHTGSLTAGKLADFVVMSENPLEVAPDDLKDLRPLATFIGGERVTGELE